MKKAILLLIVIFVFGYILRVMYLPQKSLTFGYDQARDHLQAKAIIEGDYKMQGPSASTPGLHHGVLWFYYLVPPVFISGGDPIISAYWNAFFNSLVIFLVFYLSFMFTKDYKAGLFSALIFAVSYEATQYATWLSNPTIGICTVPIVYIGLWIWINNIAIGSNTLKLKKLKVRFSILKTYVGPIITGIGIGFSTQANVFLIYHIVPVIIWLIVKRAGILKSQILVFILSFMLSILPMILSEIKFGFRGVYGIISLLSSQDAIIASKKFGDIVLLFFNQIGGVYANNSFPLNVGYGGAIVFILIILLAYRWKVGKRSNSIWEPFLITWLFAHLSVVSVGGTSTPFLLVGIGPAVAILIGTNAAYFWEKSYQILAIVILSFVVFGNIYMIKKENFKGQTIFSIQKDMLLSRQISLIDYTYASSNGNSFSINSLTSPLWINIVWTYLYKWYGETKYGYLPTFHGLDQVGQLDSLEMSDRSQENYVIIEPLAGIPLKYYGELMDEENYYSSINDEVTFGNELVVQRRKMKSSLQN